MTRNVCFLSFGASENHRFHSLPWDIWTRHQSEYHFTVGWENVDSVLNVQQKIAIMTHLISLQLRVNLFLSGTCSQTHYTPSHLEGLRTSKTLQISLPDAVGLPASCAIILSPSEFLKSELRLDFLYPLYDWLGAEVVVPLAVAFAVAAPVEHLGVGRCWVSTVAVAQLQNKSPIYFQYNAPLL